MNQAELSDQLLDFIREQFLDADSASGLDGETPLLEWGILTSLNTARLLSHIRTEFDCAIPAVNVSARNFKNVNALARMIVSLSDEAAVQEGKQTA